MIELLAQSSGGDGGFFAGLFGLAILIGIPVLFGMWSANAAERKGIDRTTGWLLGIFLGLFGRIIVGVMRDRTLQHNDLQVERNHALGNITHALPSRPDTN